MRNILWRAQCVAIWIRKECMIQWHHWNRQTNKAEKGKKDTHLNSWVLTEKNLFTIRNALSNKKVKPLFITKVLHIIRNNVHIATSVIISSAEHTGESLVTGHCSEAECLLSPAAIHSFPCVNSVKYCNCKKAKSAKFGGVEGGWGGGRD